MFEFNPSGKTSSNYIVLYREAIMSNSYDRHALILIDLINPFDFNGGTDLYQHTLEIVPHLNRLKDFARTQDIPIIYVNDHYEIWQSSPEPIIRSEERRVGKDGGY